MELAEEYGFCPATVSNYADKYAEEEKIEDRRKYNGKQSTLSGRDQRSIIREFKKNPTLSLRGAQMEIEPNISYSTIRNVLNQHEIGAYKQAVRPPLDSKTRRLRLSFAKRYNEPVGFWQNVLFSDESWVHCHIGSHKTFVWRTKCTRLDPKNVKVQHAPGKGFMVWAYISSDGPGDILHIEKDIDAIESVKILKRGLPHDVDFTLIQDNAPPHTAEITLDYLDLHDIDSFEDFPPYSPDLNPVENVWAKLKRYLSKRPSRNTGELWGKVQSFWDSLEMDYITTLIHSMPHRLDNVIRMKGGYTTY